MGDLGWRNNEVRCGKQFMTTFQNLIVNCIYSVLSSRKGAEGSQSISVVNFIQPSCSASSYSASCTCRLREGALSLRSARPQSRTRGLTQCLSDEVRGVRAYGSLRARWAKPQQPRTSPLLPQSWHLTPMKNNNLCEPSAPLREVKKLKQTALAKL